MMHCTECNLNNEQRNSFNERVKYEKAFYVKYHKENPTDTKTYEIIGCPLCKGARQITFHRYIQWRLGFVAYLDGDCSESQLHTMNQRCKLIIEKCYAEYHKKGRPVIKECDNYDVSPEGVLFHYSNQFTGKDCVTR